MSDAGYFFFKISVSGEFCESNGPTKFQTRNYTKEQAKRSRWKWVGHVCRMSLTSIRKVAMCWTPGGKRARGEERTLVELGPRDEADSGQELFVPRPYV